MWYGGECQTKPYANVGLTVGEFLLRLRYTTERYPRIPKSRWEAMLRQKQRLIDLGLDIDQISAIMHGTDESGQILIRCFDATN